MKTLAHLQVDRTQRENKLDLLQESNREVLLSMEEGLKVQQKREADQFWLMIMNRPKSSLLPLEAHLLRLRSLRRKLLTSSLTTKELQLCLILTWVICLLILRFQSQSQFITTFVESLMIKSYQRWKDSLQLNFQSALLFPAPLLLSHQIRSVWITKLCLPPFPCPQLPQIPNL